MRIKRVIRNPVIVVTSDIKCSIKDGLTVLLFPNCTDGDSCNAIYCPSLASTTATSGGLGSGELYKCEFQCTNSKHSEFFYVQFASIEIRRGLSARICEIKQGY